MRRFGLVLICCLFLASRSQADVKGDDPLAAWSTGVQVHPVTSHEDRHEIHTYYITSPESPDGRWVLFYTSTTREGYEGEIHAIERATGQEKVIARNVTVEDAHRAACQQWLDHGKQVAFHDVRDNHWLVVVVDFETLKERILATDHQIGFGTPDGTTLPVYRPHWKPGEHRDLDLVDSRTGKIETVVTDAAVEAQYADWIKKAFDSKPTSIFFPVLSPDHHKVFFKMASAREDNFRSSKASLRLGLICYDLEHSKFLFLRENWGHPAWSYDSKLLIEPGGIVVDADTGESRRFGKLPAFHGDHPSFSPDGQLFATDTTMNALGGKATDWGIVVGRLSDGKFTVIHTADNSHGARSWRVSHPHPSFSPDGKRIYFNVNSGEFTRLFVAEIP
jgi:Tol biopolymer transport system component